MSEEEINEALKIIKEPIIVNSIEYKYFNQKNYEKLLSVYENAKWFVSNWEQALQNINNLQQKVEQQENEINRLNNIINELEKKIQENKFWIYNDVLETRENFEVIDVDYILDKLKALKEE